PVAAISACWLLPSGLNLQSSFHATRPPEELRSSRTGSESAPPNGSDGPMARRMTLFACVPVTINPPIRRLVPVSTRKRVEIFPKAVVEEGGGVGVPQGPPVTVTLSMRQPGALVASSVPIRKRSLIACPL